MDKAQYYTTADFSDGREFLTIILLFSAATMLLLFNFLSVCLPRTVYISSSLVMCIYAWYLDRNKMYEYNRHFHCTGMLLFCVKHTRYEIFKLVYNTALPIGILRSTYKVCSTHRKTVNLTMTYLYCFTPTVCSCLVQTKVSENSIGTETR